MGPADVIVLVAYASLIVELTVFPIPSEASTLDLLTKAPGEQADTDALSVARSRSTANKLFVFLLPTGTGVLLFLMPLAAIAWPPLAAYLFPMPIPSMLLAGLVVVVLGRVLTFSSVLQLRAAKRRKAIPAGWFRHSRNPGLVGMFAFYLGLCLAFGGPWLWLGVPIYFANMHHRVRLEEANLEAAHGASWCSYADRVARYLPLPGLR